MSYNYLDINFIGDLIQIKDESGKTLWEVATSLFLESYEQKFLELKESIVEKDKDKTRHLSHTLRSSSGNIGLIKISEIFSKIDNNCSSKTDSPDWDLISRLVLDLEEVNKHSLQEINSLQDSLK